MAKHTQTISRLLPADYLSVFDHFEGLALKGLGTEKTGIRICFRRFSDVYFGKHETKPRTTIFSFKRAVQLWGFKSGFPLKDIPE